MAVSSSFQWLSLRRFCRLAGLATFLLISNCALSQVPPAQGPEKVASGDFWEIPIFAVTNLLELKLKNNVLPELNREIDNSNPPVDVKVVLEKITRLKPHIKQTNAVDIPNRKFAVVPFKVDFALKLNNLPNRRMTQYIDINFSCLNWFLPAGDTLTVIAVAQKPLINGTGIREQILNFFTLGFYTPFINEKINQYLPGIIKQAMNFGNENKLNRIGIYHGDALDYENDALQFQFKGNNNTLSNLPYNIKITPLSVKRLKAGNPEVGTILYDSIENINIELFINHNFKSISVTNIRENQLRMLTEPATSISKPDNNGSLILIGNIIQSNGKKDSRFIQFKAGENFGNGTQKLIIKKGFISKPQRLPNGEMSKPVEMYVDAYEITFKIEVSSTDIKQVN